MNNKKFTYKKSGVNIKAADNFVNFISAVSSKKKGKKKFNNIGGFGSITNIPNNLKNPKIVACTDGVGTKIEIANLLKKFDTIGIDLVAMSVNDLIVQGATPLFFLDYISINKINLPKLIDYAVRIPPGSNSDALCETTITWNNGKTKFKTRGLDSDQTVSAIKATEKMLNIIQS